MYIYSTFSAYIMYKMQTSISFKCDVSTCSFSYHHRNAFWLPTYMYIFLLQLQDTVHVACSSSSMWTMYMQHIITIYYIRLENTVYLISAILHTSWVVGSRQQYCYVTYIAISLIQISRHYSLFIPHLLWTSNHYQYLLKQFQNLNKFSSYKNFHLKWITL